MTQIPRPKTILTSQNEIKGAAAKEKPKNGYAAANGSLGKTTGASSNSNGHGNADNGHHHADSAQKLNGSTQSRHQGLDNPAFQPDQQEMIENKNAVYIPEADYDIVAKANTDADSATLQVSF